MPKNRRSRGEEDRRAIDDSSRPIDPVSKPTQPKGPEQIAAAMDDDFLGDISRAAQAATRQRGPSDPKDPDTQWSSGTGEVDELPGKFDKGGGPKLTHGPEGVLAPGDIGSQHREISDKLGDREELAQANFDQRHADYVAYKIFRPPFDFFAKDFGGSGHRQLGGLGAERLQDAEEADAERARRRDERLGEAADDDFGADARLRGSVDSSSNPDVELYHSPEVANTYDPTKAKRKAKTSSFRDPRSYVADRDVDLNDIDDINYNELNPDKLAQYLGQERVEQIYSGYTVFDAAKEGSPPVPMLRRGDQIMAVNGLSTSIQDTADKAVTPSTLDRGVEPRALRDLRDIQNMSGEELDQKAPWDEDEGNRVAQFIAHATSGLSDSNAPEDAFAQRISTLNPAQKTQFSRLLAKIGIYTDFEEENASALLSELMDIRSNPEEIGNRREKWQKEQIERQYLDRMMPFPEDNAIVSRLNRDNRQEDDKDYDHVNTKFREQSIYAEIRRRFPELPYKQPVQDGVAFDIATLSNIDPELASDVYDYLEEYLISKELASGAGVDVEKMMDAREQARGGNPWPLNAIKGIWQKQALNKSISKEVTKTSSQEERKEEERKAAERAALKARKEQEGEAIGHMGDNVRDMMIGDEGPEAIPGDDDDEEDFSLDALLNKKEDEDEDEILDFFDDINVDDLPPLNEGGFDIADFGKKHAKAPEPTTRRPVLHKGEEPVTDAPGSSRNSGGLVPVGLETPDGTPIVGSQTPDGEIEYQLPDGTVVDPELVGAVETNKLTQPSKGVGQPGRARRNNTLGKKMIRSYSTDRGDRAASGAGSASLGAGTEHQKDMWGQDPGVDAALAQEDPGRTCMVTILRQPDERLEGELVKLGYPDAKGPYIEVAEGQYIGMKLESDNWDTDWDPQLQEWVGKLKIALDLYEKATQKMLSGEDIEVARRVVPMWERRKTMQPGESPYKKKPVNKLAIWKGMSSEDKLEDLEFDGYEGEEAAEAMLLSAEMGLRNTADDIVQHLYSVVQDEDTKEGARRYAMELAEYVVRTVNADEDTDQDELNNLMVASQRQENKLIGQDNLKKGTDTVKTMGSVASKEDLPLIDNTKGDVYTVQATGAQYSWESAAATGDLTDWRLMNGPLRWNYDNFRWAAILNRLIMGGLARQGEGVGRWTGKRGYEHPSQYTVKGLMNMLGMETSGGSVAGKMVPKKMGQGRVGQGRYFTGPSKGSQTDYRSAESVEARTAIVETLALKVLRSQGVNAALQFADLACSDIREAADFIDNGMVLLCGFKGDEQILNGLSASIVEHNAEDNMLVVEINDSPRASVIHEDDRQIVVNYDETILIAGERRNTDIAELSRRI